jgi:hypothetical protein
MLGLHVNPDDESDVFLQKVGRLLMEYTALYSRSTNLHRLLNDYIKCRSNVKLEERIMAAKGSRRMQYKEYF